LEVDFAIGRDAQVKDIGRIIQTLNDWCEACDNMLSGIEMFSFSATDKINVHLIKINEKLNI